MSLTPLQYGALALVAWSLLLMVVMSGCAPTVKKPYIPSFGMSNVDTLRWQSR